MAILVAKQILPTMFSAFFRNTLILLILVLSYSCDEDDNPCEDCQKAIDHMCEKIQDNGCNPEFMQNALDRLEDDCGVVSGRTFAGYMAHTCGNESVLKCGTCLEEDGDIKTGHLSMANVPFELYTNANNPDVLSIHVDLDPINAAGDIVYEMDQGEFNSFDSFDPLFEGHPVTVEVYDFTDQDMLAEATEYIRIARSAHWIAIREIHVRYSFDTESYEIDFEYW